MPEWLPRYPAADILTVVIVMAVSGIAVMAIAAWLVHAVARRAIEKTTPEGVAPVIIALGALINPLHGFMPWSRTSRPDPLAGHVTRPVEEPGNEVRLGEKKDAPR